MDTLKVYLPPTQIELGWHLFIKNGLCDNERTVLVDDIDEADYIIVGLYTTATPRVLEDQSRLIVVDYGDTFERLIRPDKYFLYFKRSILHKPSGQVLDKNVIPISYPAKREFLAEKPNDLSLPRSLDVGCFFNHQYTDKPWNENRAKVARFISERFDGEPYQVNVGQVGGDGNDGRNKLQPKYHQALLDTKIVISCNPVIWEGDHRLFEAMISGALVFVDRMHGPMRKPLEHKVHLIYYDLDDLERLANDVLFYLNNEQERLRVAQQGFDFVQQHHTYVHRIDEIVDAIESKNRLLQNQ